jgi:hypothetical protein
MIAFRAAAERLDDTVLARPVRPAETRRVRPVARVADAQPVPELALRYSNGSDTVEISRAAYAAYAAFAAYTAAQGLGADGLPVRLPAVRVGAAARLAT